MKYMIHTCNARLWYVQQYLKPSLEKQGIKESNIKIWLDEENKGNLASTLESFSSLPKSGYTWHLQDDVIICSDFKERTENLEQDLCAGFCSIYDSSKYYGPCRPSVMWYSFQCYKIPNAYAHQFVKWVQQKDEEQDSKYFVQISNNMFDDYLFKEFLKEKHSNDIGLNVYPNLVENIDFLIGGSTLVKREEMMVSEYFMEPSLVCRLADEIMQ